MVETRQKKSVLMLPWLAHGHITPFLELAKKLTLRNFHIYFCSSPVNLSSIEKKLSHHPNNNNNSSRTTSIQLVELHLPSLPDLPPHRHSTKGLSSHLFPTLIKALDMTRPNLSNIIQTLKPDLIIYDVFPLWVPDLASSLNIPSVAFITSGVAFVSYMFHQSKNKEDDHDHRDFPFPEIAPDRLRIKFSIFLNYPPFIDEHGRDSTPLNVYRKSCNIILVKSLREIEGKYMDYLSVSLGKKIVSVGSLVPNPVEDDECSNIIKWLDEKEKSSTVFVSFGSEFIMSKEDVEEMAHGLELSNVNFIWVVRFQEGEKMKVEDDLPDGFLGRVREKGMVIENWAPQVKILSHSSIGGFVSHCGWGSVMESIKFGVPIIAVPMYVDQPWNARVAEVSGIALELKRPGFIGRLQRENVAKAIRQLMVEENGMAIRRKAKEISEEIKRKGDAEIDDEVVKELLQLL
ncbi:hypothetical protein FNV43_RR25459 [Rhamnella rubrinervis]|uniref:Glycosyltransferase n=1 Tax=Rhamnella rubrinervis TaxID=2594499 RepID=A0A8K0DT67_9ROSA|nr:hypothetical protein FNV43_RR25459 [Rhamnella rubrinervis]